MLYYKAAANINYKQQELMNFFHKYNNVTIHQK